MSEELNDRMRAFVLPGSGLGDATPHRTDHPQVTPIDRARPLVNA